MRDRRSVSSTIRPARSSPPSTLDAARSDCRRWPAPPNRPPGAADLTSPLPLDYPRRLLPSVVPIGPSLWVPAVAESVDRPSGDKPSGPGRRSSEFQDDGAIAAAARPGCDASAVVTTAGRPGEPRRSRRRPRRPLRPPRADHAPGRGRGCHGGMGTTQKALAFGVLVRRPPGTRPVDVAADVVACGARTRVAGAASPRATRPAVDEA